MNKKKVIATVFVSLALLALIFYMVNSVSFVQASSTGVCATKFLGCYGGGRGNCHDHYGYTYYSCQGTCNETSPVDMSTCPKPKNSASSPTGSSGSIVATTVCSSIQHCSAGGGHGNSGGTCTTTSFYYSCQGTCNETKSQGCLSTTMAAGSPSSSSSSTPGALNISQGVTAWETVAGDCYAMKNSCGANIFVGKSTTERDAFDNYINKTGNKGCFQFGYCTSSSISGTNSGSSGTGVGYTTQVQQDIQTLQSFASSMYNNAKAGTYCNAGCGLSYEMNQISQTAVNNVKDLHAGAPPLENSKVNLGIED